MQLQHNPWLVRYLLLGLTAGIPAGLARQPPVFSACLAIIPPVVGLWIWLWPYWRPRWAA